ncbi:hypothetical protein BDY19DRAFT_960808 [Irpex rosettiformis]|uniref:Uncharacterized protein n=1 Tax=Irpex rosettiformis TaxID=378272 RepID=A0ACB8TWE4_9APHY|nr:hypothetical protein BDY19DRAFT_960808 [Irpex rosettiformis]
MSTGHHPPPSTFLSIEREIFCVRAARLEINLLAMAPTESPTDTPLLVVDASPGDDLRPGEATPSSEDPAEHDTTKPDKPQINLGTRILMVIFFAFLLTTFLGSIFTLGLALVTVQATTVGISLITILLFIPGPLQVSLSLKLASLVSPGTPFAPLPVFYPFLRTTLVGSAVCGVCAGVFFGTSVTVACVGKEGVNPQACRATHGAVPSTESPNLNNGGTTSSKHHEGKIKDSPTLLKCLFKIVYIVAPTAVISVGIWTQTECFHVDKDSDPVVGNPLYSAAVTLVGHLVALGLCSLWTWCRAMLGRKSSPGVLHLDGGEEKLAVNVDDGIFQAADNIKENDSPV